MMEIYNITIGRQPGSGGGEIGKKLAALLGIAFYDKELIRIASRESGLHEEFFEKADEKKRFRIFGSFPGINTPSADNGFTNYYLSNETLFKIQSDVIRKLAQKQSSLFMGRCADYVLKDNPYCLNLFISADLSDRVRRVSEIHGLTKAKAKEFIEKTDKIRSDYYGYFSGKTWGSAESYHMCINSSILGIDETVNYIFTLVKKRFGL